MVVMLVVVVGRRSAGSASGEAEEMWRHVSDSVDDIFRILGQSLKRYVFIFDVNVRYPVCHWDCEWGTIGYLFSV